MERPRNRNWLYIRPHDAGTVSEQSKNSILGGSPGGASTVGLTAASDTSSREDGGTLGPKFGHFRQGQEVATFNDAHGRGPA